MRAPKLRRQTDVDIEKSEAVDQRLGSDSTDETVAILITGLTESCGERYELGALFVSWASHAGYVDWTDAVRSLARTLRGLTALGLIERRPIRRPGRATHHGFVLTAKGREAVGALSGDWIKEVDR